MNNRSGMRWTEDEVNYLKRNYQFSDTKIGEKLGRSRSAVNSKRQELGVPSDKWERLFKPEFLTEEEKVYRIVKKAAEMRVRLLG